MDFDDMMLDRKLDHVIAMNNLDAMSDEANRHSVESDIVGGILTAIEPLGSKWSLSDEDHIELASAVFRAIERGDIPHVRIGY
jgi:hypothetical protein